MNDSTKCPNCGHLVLVREDARTLAEVEKERYQAAIRRFPDNFGAAAVSLGVSRSTLYRWMKRNGFRRQKEPSFVGGGT